MPDFVGFVGDAYTAPSITQDAQATENWYPEIDPAKPQGSRGVIALYPTPGMRAAGIQDVDIRMPVRGLFTMPGARTMVGVIGNWIVIWEATGSGPFEIALRGAGPLLNTSTGPVAITANATHVMITDGSSSRYFAQNNLSSFGIINDGGFNGGVRCDIVDNVMVYNAPGGGSKAWGATSALAYTSPALSYALTLSSFDNLVSLIVDQRQVALLGEQTMEFWTDVGSFPFPFSIIDGTTRQFGCIAPYSVARFADGFAWLGRDQLGQGVVLYCAHYQVQRISTHAIEQDLIGQVLTDAYAFTYQLAGHVFYVLQLPTADRTWVYDLSTSMWHRRTSMAPDGSLHRWRATCAAVFDGSIIVGDEEGRIQRLDNAYPFEDSRTGLRQIRRLRRAPHLTRELKRQFFHSLKVQFQPGVGIPTGQGDDPQAMLRYSDDGAHTWSDVLTAPIGRMGEYQAQAVWRRLGQARDRVFEVSITDPVYAPIVSANIEMSEGVF